jgi:two-component system sensor histidine kinase KdpD
VAVTARPFSSKLVRRGYQLAHRLGGDLWVVHVKPSAVLLRAEDQAIIDDLRVLTGELQGHFIEVSGEDVADEMISFARSHQITFIVMGQSARGRIDEILKGSIVNRIMRDTRNIDVVIVAESDRPENRTKRV